MLSVSGRHVEPCLALSAPESSKDESVVEEIPVEQVVEVDTEAVAYGPLGWRSINDGDGVHPDRTPTAVPLHLFCLRPYDVAGSDGHSIDVTPNGHNVPGSNGRNIC